MRRRLAAQQAPTIEDCQEQALTPPTPQKSLQFLMLSQNQGGRISKPHRLRRRDQQDRGPQRQVFVAGVERAATQNGTKLEIVSLGFAVARKSRHLLRGSITECRPGQSNSPMV